jgi:hypothetical protein
MRKIKVKFKNRNTALQVIESIMRRYGESTSPYLETDNPSDSELVINVPNFVPEDISFWSSNITSYCMGFDEVFNNIRYYAKTPE